MPGLKPGPTSEATARATTTARTKTKYRDLSTAQWTIRASIAPVEMTFVLGWVGENRQRDRQDLHRRLFENRSLEAARPAVEATPTSPRDLAVLRARPAENDPHHLCAYWQRR